MKRIFFLLVVIAMIACKDEAASAKDAATAVVDKTEQKAAAMKDKAKPKAANKAKAPKSKMSDDKMWSAVQSKAKLSNEQVAELKQIEANRKASLKGEKDKKKRQDINKQARKSELKLLGKDLYKEYRAVKSEL